MKLFQQCDVVVECVNSAPVARRLAHTARSHGRIEG